MDSSKRLWIRFNTIKLQITHTKTWTLPDNFTRLGVITNHCWQHSLQKILRTYIEAFQEYKLPLCPKGRNNRDGMKVGFPCFVGKRPPPDPRLFAITMNRNCQQQIAIDSNWKGLGGKFCRLWILQIWLWAWDNKVRRNMARIGQANNKQSISGAQDILLKWKIYRFIIVLFSSENIAGLSIGGFQLIISHP